jgi:hypothetical protein
MDLLSSHHVDRKWPQLAGLVAAVAGLYVAGGIGMAYVAGFDAVHQRLAHAQWWWLGPSFGAIVLAFCGYYFAYRGVKGTEGGPRT